VRAVNDANQHPGVAALTFEEYAKGAWKQYLDSRDLKPATRYVYDSNERVHLLPYFGSRLLEDIAPADIGAFLALARIRKLAPHYCVNLYALLRLMFGVAVDYEMLTGSPVRSRIHRPRSEQVEKPALSGAQVARVIAEVEAAWQPLVLCLALTGVRAGELVAHQWKHIDLSQRVLSVQQSLWRGQLVKPKTKASAADVPMSKWLVQAIEEHRQRSFHTEPDDFVFCDAAGRPLDSAVIRTQVIYPALDRAGIPRVKRGSGLHLFRHTAASLVHQQTGSIKLAQTLLRHARLSTTANVYTHVSGAERHDVAEALREAVFPSCSPDVLQQEQPGSGGRENERPQMEMATSS
jgi:integrase